MSIAREFPTTCRTDNHSEADAPPLDRQSPEALRHTHLDLHCYLNVALVGHCLTSGVLVSQENRCKARCTLPDERPWKHNRRQQNRPRMLSQDLCPSRHLISG